MTALEIEFYKGATRRYRSVLHRADGVDIELDGGRIVAEGDLDFRGTMGVDREAPVGFRSIRLRFELPSVDGEQLESLLKQTGRYCVVYQTLARGVPVEIDAG